MLSVVQTFYSPPRGPQSRWKVVHSARYEDSFTNRRCSPTITKFQLYFRVLCWVSPILSFTKAWQAWSCYRRHPIRSQELRYGSHWRFHQAWQCCHSPLWRRVQELQWRQRKSSRQLKSSYYFCLSSLHAHYTRNEKTCTKIDWIALLCKAPKTSLKHWKNAKICTVERWMRTKIETTLTAVSLSFNGQLLFSGIEDM